MHEYLYFVNLEWKYQWDLSASQQGYADHAIKIDLKPHHRVKRLLVHLMKQLREYPSFFEPKLIRHHSSSYTVSSMIYLPGYVRRRK